MDNTTATTPEDKRGKRFSVEEVNDIIRKRLAKAKQKHEEALEEALDKERQKKPPVYIVVIEQPGVFKRLLNKFKR